jgi:hypothetical protein
MSKKILAIPIIIVLAGIAGFATYQYVAKPLPNPQNSTPATDNQNSQNTQESPGVTLENPVINGQETVDSNIAICSYKCGDGVCQSKQPTCAPGSINCVCVETKADCPEDCK